MSEKGQGSKPKKSEGSLPEPIRQLLNKTSIPEKDRRLIEVQIASYFKGPLPHPDILREYESIVPGGAERIFARFEKQSDHRMQLEDFAIREELKQSSRGQIFGLVISLFGLGAAVALALMGHEIIAATLAGGTIVSLATVFIIGKAKQATPDNSANK